MYKVESIAVSTKLDVLPECFSTTNESRDARFVARHGFRLSLRMWLEMTSLWISEVPS